MSLHFQTASAATGSEGSNDGVIVANDDTFTYWAGSGVPWLDVEPNDVTDESHYTPVVDLDILSEGESGLSLYAGGVTMKIPRDRKADIDAQYRRQDSETGVYSNWATIHIHVKPIKGVRTKQPGPGRLKLINPNDGATSCDWGTRSGSADGPDGHARIAAHSSKVVRIHRKTLYLICSIGPNGATTAARMLRRLK